MYSVVSVPLGVILKTVPQPLGAAVAAGSATACPVEVSVGGLHQPAVRVHRHQHSSVESKSCKVWSACRLE